MGKLKKYEQRLLRNVENVEMHRGMFTWSRRWLDGGLVLVWLGLQAQRFLVIFPMSTQPTLSLERVALTPS